MENQEISFENIDIDSIETVESAPQFDAKEFDGTRVKIADIKNIVVDSHYVDGSYNSEKTVKQPMIEVTTEPVKVIDTEDGPKDIIARERFTLQEVDGKLAISKHPKAKLWKFMRKMGVAKLSDLKGKIVTLTAEPSKDPNDDRYWLRIVV